MRVFGLDFTSAPRAAKPIACAACTLDGDRLWLDAFAAFHEFELFENFLDRDGPWIAGIDFPFGQPARLVRGLGWPHRWADYVALVAGLQMEAFESLLGDYRQRRPPGDKHHLRDTDRVAGARSPMMLFGVPVGRMFFHGAPRLLASGVSVLPCHPTATERVVVEAYPALAARKLLARRSYKNDSPRKQTSNRRAARMEIVQALGASRFTAAYGLRLEIPDVVIGELVEDPSADFLDALLCAMQAGWAWRRRDDGYGIALDANPDEGWIVDPATVTGRAAAAAT